MSISVEDSAPESALPSRLLRGLSVYQDVRLGSRTVYKGVRDCAGRWELIAPWIPDHGTVLDIGSNFGWFGVRIAETFPQTVVMSVEADLRSAAVQRHVLASQSHRRILLATCRADRRMMARLEAVEQRFAVSICFSVLHWIRDHRAFMTRLGSVSERILVEHPHPDEPGAGLDQVRQEIGQIGDYLRACFPARPVIRLGEVASHLDEHRRRELWLVDRSPDMEAESSVGIDAAMACELSPAWPPRSWWHEQLARHATDQVAENLSEGRWLLGPDGLEFIAGGNEPQQRDALARHIRRIPERSLESPREWIVRRGRRIGGRAWRAFARLRPGA